jgi:hypothetical protein
MGRSGMRSVAPVFAAPGAGEKTRRLRRDRVSRGARPSKASRHDTRTVCRRTLPGHRAVPFAVDSGGQPGLCRSFVDQRTWHAVNGDEEFLPIAVWRRADAIVAADVIAWNFVIAKARLQPPRPRICPGSTSIRG